jgi:hypothetical protein
MIESRAPVLLAAACGGRRRQEQFRGRYLDGLMLSRPASVMLPKILDHVFYRSRGVPFK